MNTKNYASTLPCLILALLSGLPLLAYAQAQEMARVLSSTPVVTQVSQPRQVCGETQVITAAPKSGAGALMGAIAGGAIGNSIGGGSGRALATAAGVIGGAIFGDSIEAAPAPLRQQMTSCTTLISYENRVTAPPIVTAPTYVTPTYVTPTYVTPMYVAPMYTQPMYAAPLYRAPRFSTPGVSFHFGHHGHRHGHHHDHWRWQ